MKERNLFSNEAPNETPVTLSDKQKEEFLEKMKKALQPCGILMQVVEEGRLTEDFQETLVTNIDMSMMDALKMMGYDTTSAKREKDLIRRLRNANIDNDELRQQLSEKVSLEDIREKMKVIAYAFDYWGDHHGFGYIHDIHFDSYGCLNAKMSLRAGFVSRKRFEAMKEYGFELTDSRDGEAMFATEENFRLLRKLLRESFGPDIEMFDAEMSMHTFSDMERPHVSEVEVRLRDLNVMKPWIEEYTEYMKEQNEKARNKEV